MTGVEQVAAALVAGKDVVVGNCAVIHNIAPQSADLWSTVMLHGTRIVQVKWNAGNLLQVNICMGGFPTPTTRKYINACLSALEDSPGHPREKIKCSLGKIIQHRKKQWLKTDTQQLELDPDKLVMVYGKECNHDGLPSCG